MRIRMYPAVVLVAALPAVGPVASAQGLVESLLASDGRAADGFGGALDVSLDVLVAGSPGAEALAAHPQMGAAYVFEKWNGSWVQRTRLDPGAAVAGGRFGSAVGVDGDRIVVGSPGGKWNGVRTGTLHVFRRSGPSWCECQVLTGASSTAGDDFGFALTTEGDRMAVGAPLDSQLQPGGGRVFVFQESNGGWNQVAELTPPGLVSVLPQEFGAALALEGERLAVGAPQRELRGVGKGAGAVFLFEHTAAGWNWTRTLFASDPQPGERFGAALAWNQGRLAIGSPESFAGGQKVGRVTVFDLNTAALDPIVEFAPPGSPALARFGSELAWDGALLVVAGTNFHGIVPGAGRLWLFGESGGGWLELGVIDPHKPTDAHAFGSSLAADGDELFVGAEGASALLLRQGEVAVRTLSTLPEFEAYCLGVSCPCGNVDELAGCSNSSGRGARLSASGSVSVGATDLSLYLEHLVPNRMMMIAVGSPVTQTIAGDGFLCVSPSLGASGLFVPPTRTPTSGALHIAPGRLVQWSGASAGDRISLQAWYRDPHGPCSMYFNSSNALSLGLLP